MVVKPRLLSLFTQSEVDTMFKTARRTLRSGGLVILRAPKTKDFGRILVITGRKVGNAPERNKLRRQLKAIFYEEHLWAKESDVVVITSKAALENDFSSLKQLLLQALQ